MYYFILIAVIVGGWIWQRYRHMTYLRRCGIPGPMPNLILGNSLEFAKKGSAQFFTELTEKYGPVVGFYLGGCPQIVVADVDLLRNILVKDFNVFSARNGICKGGVHPTRIGQSHLIWVKGEEWKNQRATISPSFSSAKLTRMVDTILEKAGNCMEGILDKKETEGTEFDISRIMKSLTFQVISNCAFGTNATLDEQSPTTKAMLESIIPKLEKSILATLMILFPGLTPVLWPFRYLWETFRYYMLWAPESIVFDLSSKIVAQRKREGSSRSDLLQNLLDVKQRIDKVQDKELTMGEQELDELIRTNKERGLSDDEVVSNTFVFLLAGFETTSVALAFIIHHLTNYPEKQEELRQLIKESVDKEGEIDYESVTKIPYLTAFIKETLRIYPPVAPFVTRVAEDDYEYGNMVIPKGCGVFVGVTQLQNDPEIWPDPTEFKPERFYENYEQIAYQAFGYGPRNCIGMRFAYLELQLVVVSLLMRYRFEAGPSSEIGILKTAENFATRIPKNGVYCKLIKLEK